mmetsp:Transcript_7529/g.22518  ORF Transcript_7529/g.22518 Transcript_7529/m.22518 type:complete len:255 (+) Transcript_7529:1306-2070(+)
MIWSKMVVRSAWNAFQCKRHLKVVQAPTETPLLKSLFVRRTSRSLRCCAPCFSSLSLCFLTSSSRCCLSAWLSADCSDHLLSGVPVGGVESLLKAICTPLLIRLMPSMKDALPFGVLSTSASLLFRASFRASTSASLDKSSCIFLSFSSIPSLSFAMDSFCVLALSSSLALLASSSFNLSTSSFAWLHSVSKFDLVLSAACSISLKETNSVCAASLLFFSSSIESLRPSISAKDCESFSSTSAVSASCTLAFFS